MTRTAAAVAFLAVAGYSALRFTWSVRRPGLRRSYIGITAAGVPDLSHALMGVAMALMVAPAGPAVPGLLGIAVFAVVGAWFAAQLRHDGLLGRTAQQAAGGRLGVLGKRDARPGHSGYHLHHLVGCAAMVLMYATGHGALSSGEPTANAAADRPAPTVLEAPAALDATHAAAGVHAAVPPLVAVCWLFGLYFLVAATSLGFRVGEPAVRVTHHAAAPLTPSPDSPADPSPVPPVAARPVARLLASPAGTCASEVVLSAGMAVLFFSAL
jgi:hypothetical protein